MQPLICDIVQFLFHLCNAQTTSSVHSTCLSSRQSLYWTTVMNVANPNRDVKHK
ncbi:hypothetical protein PROFUN_00870 [Planoprotostelium fungivorum]|uniref:Uncharacterized protein n=1 Tax=Planoprotostelium fungivorum TaxID=1890364 RepID=A0A2P6P066_9EUKA|nr:hypothetical protein PROFUN_00870 [Planoprotostelium fungivorum]